MLDIKNFYRQRNKIYLIRKILNKVISTNNNNNLSFLIFYLYAFV